MSLIVVDVEADGPIPHKYSMVSFGALEFKLLQYLIEHRGKALKRDELLDEVWGYDATPSTWTVDVHIA
jgi:two-component system alkaline phosphatase synthesis response regulator PhoP